MHLKITVTGEGKPLFLIVTSIGAALLAAFAAVIGVTPFERRAILTILFTLFFFSFLTLASFVDRRMSRWYFHGNELYYRYIRRIAYQRDQAIERAEVKRTEIDALQSHNEQLEKALREAQRDLEERERQLGAAQRKIKLEVEDKEALRQEAQQKLTIAKTENEILKHENETLKQEIATMKTEGQSIVEYALILAFMLIVCVAVLAPIGIFPVTVFAQLTESFP